MGSMAIHEKKGVCGMIEQIRKACIEFRLEYDRHPTTVYMSEGAYKEALLDTQCVIFMRENKPSQIFGMDIVEIPYPDNLVIVGGVKVDGI